MCFRLLQLFSDILDAVLSCQSCSSSSLHHQHDKASRWTHALPQPLDSTEAILLDVYKMICWHAAFDSLLIYLDRQPDRTVDDKEVRKRRRYCKMIRLLLGTAWDGKHAA